MTTTTTSLWARRQVGIVAFVNALTAAMLLFAVLNDAAESWDTSTVVWLSATVAVLVVAAAADLSILAVGRSAILHRRRRIIDDLPAPTPHVENRHRDDGTRVRVPGLERLHLPGCMLVAGKETVPVVSADLATRRRCEVCEP